MILRKEKAYLNFRSVVEQLVGGRFNFSYHSVRRNRSEVPLQPSYRTNLTNDSNLQNQFLMLIFCFTCAGNYCVVG